MVHARSPPPTLPPVPSIDSEQVRARLETRLAEIESTRSRMHRDAEGMSENELSDSDQHPGDGGTEMHEQELDQTTDVFLEDERGRVEVAMRKLEEGTYGICEVCGKEIPTGRLEAMPEAIRCVEDQRGFEGEHRMGNKPPIDR